MLGPRKDLVGADALYNAVVNLGSESLVPHEVSKMASALQTRVPQNVFGVPVRSYRRRLSFGRFWHSDDLGHNTGSLIAVCLMPDRC